MHFVILKRWYLWHSPWLVQINAAFVKEKVYFFRQYVHLHTYQLQTYGYNVTQKSNEIFRTQNIIN